MSLLKASMRGSGSSETVELKRVPTTTTNLPFLTREGQAGVRGPRLWACARLLPLASVSRVWRRRRRANSPGPSSPLTPSYTVR
jgi:hypothetical protein